MYVRIISLGSNWWAAHSADRNDPFCFRRRAAWFNSACLKSGRRVRFCWIYPGQIRFNQSSRFHPEFPQRVIGKVFWSEGPTVFGGKTHLLFSRPASIQLPDSYVITLSDPLHGQIHFRSSDWKSSGVQPVSISSRGQRYEAVVLLSAGDWIETGIGRWSVAADGDRLELTGSVSEVA